MGSRQSRKTYRFSPLNFVHESSAFPFSSSFECPWFINNRKACAKNPLGGKKNVESEQEEAQRDETWWKLIHERQWQIEDDSWIILVNQSRHCVVHHRFFISHSRYFKWKILLNRHRSKPTITMTTDLQNVVVWSEETCFDVHCTRRLFSDYNLSESFFCLMNKEKLFRGNWKVNWLFMAFATLLRASERTFGALDVQLIISAFASLIVFTAKLATWRARAWNSIKSLLAVGVWQIERQTRRRAQS